MYLSLLTLSGGQGAAPAVGGEGKENNVRDAGWLGWDVISYCIGLIFGLNPVCPGCQGPLLMTYLPWTGG